MNTKSEKQKSVEVLHEGDKITIPPGMSYADARKWLERQEQAEEQFVNIASGMACFPLDGVIAVARAFTEKFGFTELQGRNWFSAPTIVEVTTATGYESAPLGNVCPPKWEGGFLCPMISGPSVTITGTVKRKHEAEAKEIIKLSHHMLNEKSIYKGQAISMDLSWMDRPPEDFHPENDAPKFMKLGEAQLILNEDTEFDMATSVYMLLERTAACKANRIPLKHGVLLKGPFGTGKTLSAKVIARKATHHGWTFIYITKAAQLAKGLRLAMMYTPAVVFCEDVDTVTEKRDQNMNTLLNVLDGVDTKDAQILTILTTNKDEKIDPSFLRAGRIDSVIHFGEPEAETAIRFVKEIAGKLLNPHDDLKEVGRELAGLVPAFICEAVNKAKRYAIFRTGKEQLEGQVVAEDLLLAAKSVKRHNEMLHKDEPSEDQRTVSALRVVARQLSQK